jgi:hypothetical protein
MTLILDPVLRAPLRHYCATVGGAVRPLQHKAFRLLRHCATYFPFFKKMNKVTEGRRDIGRRGRSRAFCWRSGAVDGNPCSRTVSVRHHLQNLDYCAMAQSKNGINHDHH